MAATEVTNAQYEQFDPSSRQRRLKIGLDAARAMSQFSTETGGAPLAKPGPVADETAAENAAVVFVSWNDAVRFCQWLSKKEGKPYRLPTEAEWEYACRAGTTTAFSTGDTLPPEYHENQENQWVPRPVSLVVGATPANPWGLHDMHGNVEEWCMDWYGLYAAGEQTDPLGDAEGEFRVTRGGSHNTNVAYLRSANRLGTLPDDRHWMIGFRVVQAEPVLFSLRERTAPSRGARGVHSPAPPRWARDVRQDRCDWTGGPNMKKPHFKGPRRFVHVPPDSDGPLFSKHNHQPSIAWCLNGDLLAVWFSTNTEAGRELTVVASRLRRGQDAWEPANVFFKAPDRNMTGSAIWHDGQGTLFHTNGLSHASGWALLAMTMRTSRDNGATWSAARLIQPEHHLRHQVISGTLRTREGVLIQACDANPAGNGGSAIHLSRDGGKTWTDPSEEKGTGPIGAPTNAARRYPPPGRAGQLDLSPLPRRFAAGETGRTIAGIHAGVVELRDGRLMALGRGDPIAGRMPKSLSSDLGKTWTYSAGPFRPIGSGQRLVLLRLREGPLMLASFTDQTGFGKRPRGLSITDAAGNERTVFGIFAAISLDEGETWPTGRLVTDDRPAHEVDGGSPERDFTMSPERSEMRGYLAATQTPDGVIHLLSSAQHYEFNLAWLKTPMAGKGVEDGDK